MTAQEGEAWGFFNRIVSAEMLQSQAFELASDIARGPTLAHAMTKTMLHREWSLAIDAALEAEAQAQAMCMQTQDFQRAYRAFAAKQRPVFKGD
jgi:enoyl-CoA hydratase/carnithine racemase